MKKWNQNLTTPLRVLLAGVGIAAAAMLVPMTLVAVTGATSPGLWRVGIGPLLTGIGPLLTGIGPRFTGIGPLITGISPLLTGIGP